MALSVRAVCENGVDPVWNGFQPVFEDLPRRLAVCFVDPLRNGELAGAINRHEEMLLAFPRSHLSHIDVEIADGVALELLPFRLVTLDTWKTRNAMPLKTPMQRRAGQGRDRRL